VNQRGRKHVHAIAKFSRYINPLTNDVNLGWPFWR
jgi:hypothetical protein